MRYRIVVTAESKVAMEAAFDILMEEYLYIECSYYPEDQTWIFETTLLDFNPVKDQDFVDLLAKFNFWCSDDEIKIDVMGLDEGEVISTRKVWSSYELVREE